MNRPIPFWTAVCGAVLCGCSSESFASEYAAIGRSADPGPALAALDQKYPNKLELKIDLGARSWSAGNLRQAEAYWRRAETLAGTAGPAADAILWADLAQAALLRGDQDAALTYADRAVEYRDEKLGAVFTRAKAHLARHENQQALADFKTGWNTKRSTMTAQDYRLYAKSLMDVQEYAQAFGVLESYRERFSYEQGTGLVESACLEHLGRYDESILLAWADVDFQQSQGRISKTQTAANLRALESKILVRNVPPDRAGLMTVRAVRSLTEGGRPPGFDAGLLAVSPEARLLEIGVRLRSGHVSETDLKTYAALERRFRSFSSYYQALLVYLRDFRRDVGSEGFVRLAERLVNCAPAGPQAAEGRAALALAWGIPREFAPVLLTQEEIDRLLPGDPRLTSLLTAPDCPAVLHTIEKLRGSASNQEVRSLLVSLKNSCAGLAKERLDRALQNR